MANGFLRKIMLPREDKFFPLFEEMAELISISAAILTSIIDHQEPHNQLDSFAEIKAAEKRTGEIVHRALEMVNSTFITPFDREDMQRLLAAMDDVIDLINSTGQEIKLYKPINPFPQCRQMAELISISAAILTSIIDHQEPHNQLDSFAEIKAAEKRTGEIVHRALEMVNSTFITPFDREDMQRLLAAMDDVIDLINSTGQEIKLYKPIKPFPQCRQMALVILNGCAQIRIAIPELRNLEKSDKIVSACQLMNKIESQGDDIYYDLITSLFEMEKDPIELIKYKQIIETLEEITDRIKDVSDVLMTIIIKAA